MSDCNAHSSSPLLASELPRHLGDLRLYWFTGTPGFYHFRLPLNYDAEKWQLYVYLHTNKNFTNLITFITP